MKKVIENYDIKKLSELNNIERNLVSIQIYQSLLRLNIEYPGFKKWYQNLFYDNGMLKEEREILYCKLKDSIIAVSILKSTEDEKKICTFRVERKFQGEGIGRRLMEKSLECLDTEKPLITVHKSKEQQFSKLFAYYDFKPEQTLKRYYRCFTEVSYNGILPEKKILINRFELINLKKFLYRVILENKFDEVQNVIEDYINQYFKDRYVNSPLQ